MMSTISRRVLWVPCLAALPSAYASPPGGAAVRDPAFSGDLWQATPVAEGVEFEEQHDEHDHADEHGGPERGPSSLPLSYPEALGMDLTRGWMDPWPHRHFSRRGTPFVHLFGFEPAFLDRDVFLDYRAARGNGGDEAEVELELEWALTRRLGLVVEAPYLSVGPAGESTETGLGDVGVGGRALLVEMDRFLLSGNLAMSLPSGSQRDGLGSGEAGLAPSLSAWLDLGNWFQANAQVGTQHGLESGDAEFTYGAAVAYSFKAPGLFDADSHHPDDGHDHEHAARHFPSGLTSVIVELTGRSILEGDDSGRDTAEALLGISYTINASCGVRGGYQFPVGRPRDFDEAFILSLVYHF